MVGYKIVVCNDSASLAVVIDNIISAKVAAGLFISKDSFLEFFVRFLDPGAFISPEDGLTILKYVNQSSDPIAFQQTILGSKPTPVVANLHLQRPVS